MDATAECDGAGNGEELTAWLSNNGGASATDACGGVSWSHDFDALSEACGATGAASVTFTATDDCGNATSTTATFTIEDTTSPEVTDAMDATAECDGAGNGEELTAWLSNNGGASATDACGGVSWSHDFDALSEACGATGAASVTFTATDDCGNATSTTATFTIEDTTSPAFTSVPVDYTLSCDEELILDEAFATDNCSEVMISVNEEVILDVFCPAAYTIIRTFRADDACGNFANAVQTISIVDTSAPVFEAESSIEISCDSWPDGNLYATATDNCGNIFMSYSDVEGSEGCVTPVGSYIRTYTAVDDCGNQSDFVQTIVLVDDVAPVLTLTCPQDASLLADEACGVDTSVEALGTATIEASDNCDANLAPQLSITDGPISSICVGTYSFVRTFSATVTDQCGNNTEVSCEQSIVVEDIAGPSLNEAMDATVECDGAGNSSDLQAWLANQGGASAFDGCSDVTWTNDFDALSNDCGATGTATVTFTAMDDCSNAASTVATFTIEDTTAPSMEEAVTVTVECDGAGNAAELEAWLASNGGAFANELCGAISWSNDFVALSDDCGASAAATVVFTATDECGNATSTTASFLIEDTQAPIIEASIEIYLACDVYSPDSIYEATFMDACADDVDVSMIDQPFTGGCLNVNQSWFIRTYTATDACGNASTYEQIIYLFDDVAPVVSIDFCPADVSVTLDETCSGDTSIEALGMALASVTDNCDIPDLTVTYEDSAPVAVCGASYSFIRTFYATSVDGCGNVSEMVTCSQTIDVVDTQAPVVQAASDMILECDGLGNVSNLASWLADHGGASATDACGAVTWSNDFDGLSVDCSATGSATVTFTATDACGNASSTMATFTVEDTTAPAVVDAMDSTVECDGSGNTSALESWLASNGGASATDACSSLTWTNDFDALSDDCGATGTATVTFTATDDCGNATSTQATFTVEDTNAPAVADAMDMTVECDALGNGEELNAWLMNNGGATATDACGGVTWTNDYEALSDDCGATGTTTVAFTATDDCGNATSTSASFTTEDTMAPTFTESPMDQTNQCEETAYAVSATDACSSVVISENRTVISDDGCGNYEHEVTLTAEDACGNAASHQFTIVVMDTEAPSIADAEGMENGGILPVCVEDIWGTLNVPDPVSIEGFDNCDADFTLDYLETVVGPYAPTESIRNFFIPMSPEADEDGLTCDDFEVHVARLFNFVGDEFYTAMGGLMTNYEDGSRHLTLDVVSTENPNAGWTFEIDLDMGMNWVDWEGQPGSQSYKSDCGLGDYTEWMYHMMQASSTASGWGDYEDSELSLTHQPANGYFGFQMGVGANNKNANQGFSGWFFYTGTFQGVDVMGSGDVFGDLDFDLPWMIERTYTLTDCSGNASEFNYTVDVNGATCEPFAPTLDGNIADNSDSDNDADPFGNVSEEEADTKDPIKILALTPNPSSEIALLTFMASDDDYIVVYLYNGSGVLVSNLYQGQIAGGVTMTLEIPANELDNGLYQIQIISSSGVVTQKLLVTS